ncbi:MAG: class II fructose-bisphosphate aldolase [Gemmatimonadales bacterium]|nr:class II fructose-bisphosphate aldolase [Gemmatimonadales bacterium]
MADEIQRAVGLYDGAVALVAGGVTVRDPAKLRSPSTDRLVWQAVFDEGEEREAARWLLWELGQVTGARPASIQGLYEARGRGDVSGFTVPAINIRALAYDTARAVFRAARAGKAGAIILEIARSEIAYTEQRPAEYVAVLIGAALREGYVLPLFIQGDHCQVNHKKYHADPEAETGEVKKLIAEEVGAGFYNIDVDTSTLVDLEPESLDEQQRLNYERAAEITAFIRAHEPEGITVSVGGEIGEVGMKNSTVDELHAFMRGYNRTLANYEGELTGISKISVQTGTSHGGVVLADGSMADVKLDLEALAALSKAAREEYGLAGAVQHGASTLPSTAFGNFPRIETAEIHLATNFQNMVFDHPKLPTGLRDRLRRWVDDNAAGERKAGDTAEQFYYKARKKAIGPFKREVWSLSDEVRGAIAADLERTFAFLFEQLNVNGTEKDINRFVQAPLQHHAALKPALVAAEDDPDAGE